MFRSQRTDKRATVSPAIGARPSAFLGSTKWTARPNLTPPGPADLARSIPSADLDLILLTRLLVSKKKEDLPSTAYFVILFAGQFEDSDADLYDLIVRIGLRVEVLT